MGHVCSVIPVIGEEGVSVSSLTVVGLGPGQGLARGQPGWVGSFLPSLPLKELLVTSKFPPCSLEFALGFNGGCHLLDAY